MAALRVAGLPTPAIPVLAAEPVVDGRPFVLMEAVDGTRIERAGAEERPLDISDSAVKVLKRLQALQLDRTGIGDEEPVSLQAEMMHWAWLMQRAPEELTEGTGELGGLLARNVPVGTTPTILHGHNP